MRAIMLEVPPQVMEWRRQTGADLRDEMWEGVLHMPPMAINEHQGLGGDLRDYVKHFWAKPIKARVYPEVNLASIGGWDHDYRIPDMLMLTMRHFGIDKGTHFEGPADGVVEIHSPGDEAYEKLEFYAKLGVGEVWIIHRDTKAPGIYLLRNGDYVKQRATGGWVRSPLTGLEMKKGKPGKLAIRKIGDDSTRADLPEY